MVKSTIFLILSHKKRRNTAEMLNFYRPFADIIDVEISWARYARKELKCMEIKNISGILSTYNKVKASGNKVKAAPEAKKTDKIEFNFARSVEAAKADLSAKINEDMSAERVAAMQDAVNNGTYDVSSEAIADAILSF